MPELSPSMGKALSELRTIQYLEETVGPTGLRRLADALPDDEAREVVLALRRRAATASLELESIIEDWNAAVADRPRSPQKLAPGGLDLFDLLESFVEVKRSSAELLRRAAREAPNAKIRDRLITLAAEEDQAAENLQSLAGIAGSE